MILVLFLIGASLSLRALRSVGWRTIMVGLILWVFISTTSLVAIYSLNLK
jgi:Kef-type K+ transport system membrane component KefB